jgi:rhodanese-related sulfurtransferase
MPQSSRGGPRRITESRKPRHVANEIMLEIVTFCKASLRGHEAAEILQGAGFPNVRVMDGGITAWPFEKLHG